VANQVDTITDHLEQIATAGYTIVEDAIEPELIERLTARIDGLLEELGIPFGDNTFLGQRTRRIFNLLARDPVFAAVPIHPAVLPIVEGVLDAECLLSSLTAIEMNDGQASQPFHCDDGSIPIPRPHVPLACPAIWALTDFTLENGATRVVPGSQRFDRIPRRGEQPEEVVQAVMPAGSVIIYDGGLSTTAPDSSAKRKISCWPCPALRWPPFHPDSSNSSAIPSTRVTSAMSTGKTRPPGSTPRPRPTCTGSGSISSEDPVRA
jgi:ectoine hydroxylase-related dioxygenase (phytanoyl-CoA dioxygenase family)